MNSLAIMLAICVIGGIIATWMWSKKKEHQTIASRLASWTPISARTEIPSTLLKEPKWISLENNWQFYIPGIDTLKELLVYSAMEDHLSTVLISMLVLLLLPALIALVLGLNILIAFIVGIALATIPFFVIKSKADARRNKFCEQLPDAIDLMVAILRSGNSIPHAIKAISQEIPNPCGKEFEAILHRMNLGQTLSQSLTYSIQNFRSYELDLIKRAVSIQAEIGGSLAELLDKTNFTLRERLSLARQLKVLTSQSRLSAKIVALLPIVLAIALNFISPGYLQLLFKDPLGQMLLTTAIALEIIGIIVMRRMSTLKV